MRSAVRIKLLVTLGVIFVPMAAAFGYLGGTGQLHRIVDNWTVMVAVIELRQHPDNLSATIRAGQAFYGLESYQKAADYYLQATTSSPQADLAWNGLGNAYRELSRYEDAEMAYRQAIIIQPQTAVYYLNLADLYKRWPAVNSISDKEIKTTLEAGAKATDNDVALVRALVEYYTRVGDSKTADKYQKLLPAETR